MFGTMQIDDFAARIRAKGRILYADVRRLRRVILPEGVVERGQAEILLALDRDIERAEPTFRAYLVEEIAHFAVWYERPTGRLDDDKIGWLCGVLCRERITQTGAAIAAAVLEESETDIPALVAIARRRQPRFAACGTASVEDAQDAHSQGESNGDDEGVCDVAPVSVHSATAGEGARLPIRASSCHTASSSSNR